MDYSKETILVVDDSRFQRTVIKEIFSKHFNILEAASGGECMRIIEEAASDIDLVMLDLVMSGIDGFEVLRRRQKMQEFLDIPIIVLTTSDSHEIQASAYELGANDFLVKPVDESIALVRIQNLVKSKHRVRSLIQKYIEFKVKSELDEMTGLFNKITIKNLITDALSKNKNICHALLVVDIDNFKAINDVFGHTVGDHTVSVVSNVIVSQFNGSDMVGRIGGDEFVIFISDVVSRESVYQKTDSLVRIISEKKKLSIPDNVTVSIGLAFSDGSETDYEALFLKADEALYASKRAGKSCYNEYGVSAVDADSSVRLAVAVTDSRNVASMLEFAYEKHSLIKQITSFGKEDDTSSLLARDISCLYIDISEKKDNGKELLDDVLEANKSGIPVIVICREGSMEQISLAASYGFTKDILFAPLEAGILKRRVTQHMKLKKVLAIT